MIEELKIKWVELEEKKYEPKKVLRDIAKEQRPITKSIREYMVENDLDRLDCGSGWSMTIGEVEHVPFCEDVCSSYMEPEDLSRMKSEQKKRKCVFKIVRPTKRSVS